MQNRYDNIIIGSGAGGAAAAYQLIQSGQSVLLLERGHALPKDGSTLDVSKVHAQNSFNGQEVWQDQHGTAFRPNEFFNLGGKTKWYGAALLRFSAQEFMADDSYQCQPWPLQYEDLKPYYQRAEQILKVKTFEMEPQLKKICNDLVGNKIDWHAQALPLGLSATIQQHPQEAMHFDGFASVADLKHDAQNSFLEPLKDNPRFTCLTGKQATKLLSGKNRQHIDGVACVDGDQYYADRVFLAAGALHSPRILHEYFQQTGQQNSLIGCFYKCHLNSVVLAFSLSRKTDQLRKTLLLLNKHYPHSSAQTLGWLDGELLATQLPAWIPKCLINFLGSRAYGFWLTSEDSSDKRNRIHFETAKHTRPTLDYSQERLPQSKAEHTQFIRAFKRRLLRAGMLSSARNMPVEATAHACGTLVTGDDENHSVVDPEGKVWGIDNLYVVDGSVLPRSSRVNPALTIYAWALRTAKRVAKRTGPN